MKPREKKRQKSLERKRKIRSNNKNIVENFNYNFLITSEYDGYSLGGYAKQKHKNTVQDKLEDALETILGRKVKTIESSRTDAKVHARDQKVMFKFYKNLDLDKIKESLNNMTDSCVNIISIEKVSDDFHCRYDVLNKTYYYYIMKNYSVFNRNYKYYHLKPLNIKLMKTASKYLVGTHDFTSFCSTKSTQESKIRTINSIEIEETSQDIIIKINGDGFLYNMVRIIVGTLLEFSDKQLLAQDIEKILYSQDRKKAGATAPAHGLYLHNIKYE
ncbi:MAG: tRNA pseudouridine(38-40) synthase TruA [Bacilli bacterium]